jgi:hypothetical protein
MKKTNLILRKTKTFFEKTFDKIVDSEMEWQDYCLNHPYSAMFMALTSFGLGLVLRYYICKLLNREFITFRKKEGN